MPRNDEPTTLAAILEMEPSRGRDKAWIPGRFEAVVKNAKEKRPKRGGPAFYSCELEDPHNNKLYIEATADVDFTRLEGNLVEVSGNGISREEYNGKPQLKMGRNAIVQTIGAGSGRGDSRDRNPPPRTGSSRDRAPARDAAPPRDTGAADQPERPYGPAIGNALDIAANAILTKDLAEPGTPEFAALLLDIASDVYRVNKHMAAGHFAPKASERDGRGSEPSRERSPEPERNREPERREPERGREAEREPADPEEDDVPF